MQTIYSLASAHLIHKLADCMLLYQKTPTKQKHREFILHNRCDTKY